MQTPKNVLFLTNSTTEEELHAIQQAKQHALSLHLPIKFSIVHIIPNLPTCYFNIPSMVTLTERYYEEAKETLTVIGKTLDIAKQDQWLISGRLKTEILRLANRLKSNFILASSKIIPELHSIPSTQLTLIKNINHIVNLR